MGKPVNRRLALKTGLGGLLCTALPLGAEADMVQAVKDYSSGSMEFINDASERFHLTRDSWPLALDLADRYGWSIEPWPLTPAHHARMVPLLQARAKEIETTKALQASDREFADLEQDELDLDEYREELVQAFFSPARAGGLASALERALRDPGFDDLVTSLRAPLREMIEKTIAAAPPRARAAMANFVQNLECEDLRGQLTAFAGFCHKGGFHLDFNY